MYGNESEEGEFPPMQLEVTGASAPMMGTGPMVLAVYPEYLTDPAIAICPSDSQDTLDAVVDIQLDANKRNIAASYACFGWAFDRCGEEDPQESIAPLAPLLVLLGLSSIDTSAEAPSHFVQMLVSLMQELVQRIPSTPAGEARRSVSVGIVDADRPVTAPNGNGGGTTIYRLREGVERFMVTDIANPSATAMAQSNLYIMLDRISTSVTDFNHAPGGCNVHYMDGHVAFLRYPGDEPVSEGLAFAVGILQSSRN